jgi:hypothetical protein
VGDIKFGIKLAQTLGDLAPGFCVPCLIRPRQLTFTFPLNLYSLTNLSLIALYSELLKCLWLIDV